MEDFCSIVARFPDREFEIRRRYTHNVQFKAICADYEEGAAALRQWQKAVQDASRRVEEYTNFLGELEDEILAQLDRAIESRRCR